jgi:hypothetical protein
MFEAFMFERAEAFPEKTPAVSIPETERLVRVPTLVMFT